MAQYLFEGFDPTLRERLVDGTILVVGANFGIGSSREHVPLAMKGSGIRGVVGRSFARIFYRNCVNLGLAIVACPAAADAAHDGSRDRDRHGGSGRGRRRRVRRARRPAARARARGRRRPRRLDGVADPPLARLSGRASRTRDSAPSRARGHPVRLGVRVFRARGVDGTGESARANWPVDTVPPTTTVDDVSESEGARGRSPSALTRPRPSSAASTTRTSPRASRATSGSTPHREASMCSRCVRPTRPATSASLPPSRSALRWSERTPQRDPSAAGAASTSAGTWIERLKPAT